MPEYALSGGNTAVNENAVRPLSESQIINDNLAKVAVLLDQLTKAVVELRERAAKSEAALSEIKPALDAFKTHIDSFPHALREARRSDVAVQKLIEEFSSRLAAVESTLKSAAAKA